ncbi:MAG: UDP-N-acetylglucosamine 2-epimerase [Ignavibacteria bacterium]|nr:UDP-N-acetylglucosamine 2-epimerase [Ignavibacteria bacterium]
MSTVIATIVGARPQFIKASVVSKKIKEYADLKEIIIHTGQHYDYGMSEVFFDELEIPHPDYNLNIGSGKQGEQTGKMLEKIESLLLELKPDLLVIYGDTNSTLAGALASAKLHIPIAHIEAGLRSFNKKMPEEINRIVADHCAEFLMAPTQTAVNNLKNEAISENKIFLTGDVMYDSALFFGKLSDTKSTICNTLNLENNNYILATVHRQENTDDNENLRIIFSAFIEISSQIPVILPLHPRTKKNLQRIGMNDFGNNLKIIDPVGYLDMIQLEKNAKLIATDSGGVQKEAYFYKVPCISLRTETEWVELVESGWNKIVPPKDINFVVEEIRKSLNFVQRDYQYFYGKGDAAGEIVEIISNRFIK